ncbi:hypothetical protein [Neolewinella antarctica]|uniref:Tryptophan-rich sensory protein n=1 Tax=Neolewinella antarctica TaxID=442734 RepID=A0ABX0XHK1_9BACT|nr:hypothetical protein [Neolewinella antarctica]NJC28304.1 tryptophan-rich sensory protein [Neolewinella antarctica]
MNKDYTMTKGRIAVSMLAVSLMSVQTYRYLFVELSERHATGALFGVLCMVCLIVAMVVSEWEKKKSQPFS